MWAAVLRLFRRPAAVDIGGLIITPREKDFDRLNAAMIEGIFREVSVDAGIILNSIKVVLNEPNVWCPPVEYLEENVSGKIVKLILGYERNGMTPIG